MPKPDPYVQSLDERWEEARRINAWRATILRVLEDAQRYPEVREHLDLSAQALLTETRRLWPEQAWESTSNGPPKHRDLHVKVASVTVDRDEWQPGGIALRLGLSAVHANGPLIEHAAIYIPLEVADLVIGALQAAATYWHENPPKEGRAD